MRFPRLLAVTAALLVLPLAGCAAGNSTEVAPGLAEQGGDVVGGQPGGVLFDEADPLASLNRAKDTAIAHSAGIGLTVGSTPDAVQRATEITEKLGGNIASQSLSHTANGAQFAWLDVRVPADKLDTAIEELSALGTPQEVSRNADDVTEQGVDLDARIAALDESIARLKELMRGATSTSDLIEAEGALSSRQQERDSLVAQREALSERVAMSTISVSFQEKDAVPGAGPRNFWDGVLAGLASIADFGVWLVVALGVVLPWIAILAIVILIFTLIGRARRRRAERKPESDTTSKSVEGDSSH